MQQKPEIPSPERIFNTFNAYQQSSALKAAVELDLFTAIAAGNGTAKALAEHCKASEKGIRVLADYLTVQGFLSKQQNSYKLSPDAAAFLDARSPMYLGTVARFLASPALIESFSDISGTVRKGGTLLADQGSVTPENPMWVDFARGMAPMMMPPAMAIAEIVGAGQGQKWKILDIAAGHGVFGVVIATKNPNAEIVALDWPQVLEVAEENARRFGVGDRWRKLPGDAMTVSYGQDYDLVLLTNFLHHFDTATCENILRKVHAALKPGGRVVTLEFVPNEDRVSPPVAATFSLIMLASTPSGDAYTFAEFECMFRNAGFSKSEFHQLKDLPQQVIVSHA